MTTLTVDASRATEEARENRVRGGTLRVGLACDTDSSDPGLAYHIVSWQLEHATQAKLLNYPDKPGDEGIRLVPEVAKSMPEVSEDGRTYRFELKSGDEAFRFNTGEEVTAEHFAAAIHRALNPKMQSPAAAFVGDIVGADEVQAGRSRTAEGVRVVAPDRLEIELREPGPDFLSRIAMPFFGAIPVDTPIDSEGIDVIPSAGPYYIAERTRDRSMILKRNPHYRGERPSWVDAVEYEIGIDPNEGLERIERGDLDYLADGLPPEEEARLGAEYGVNSDRFMVTPTLQLDYLALNTSRPLFSDVRVRRAINFAFDRPEGLRLRGEYAGLLTDHILPPGMPGHREADLYPLDGPDYERARAELPDDFEGGTAVVYTWSTLAGPGIGKLLRENLAPLGIDVDLRILPDTEMHQLAGRKDEPYDILVTGWVADYPDPFVFLNVLLHGGSIRDTNNVNFSYFQDEEYDRRLERAARLSGQERFDAYGQLDLDISRDVVPWVCYDNRTARDFVSDRVTGAFHHYYGLDFAALSLKPEHV